MATEEALLGSALPQNLAPIVRVESRVTEMGPQVTLRESLEERNCPRRKMPLMPSWKWARSMK